MLVLGLGGAAISIISGNLSVTISGMSLASIVGILLNLFLKSEEDEKEKILQEENKYNKLKEEIKVEVLKELKKDNNKKDKKWKT